MKSTQATGKSTSRKALLTFSRWPCLFSKINPNVKYSHYRLYSSIWGASGIVSSAWAMSLFLFARDIEKHLPGHDLSWTFLLLPFRSKGNVLLVVRTDFD